MQITFKPGRSATVWHAAQAIQAGYPVAAPGLADALRRLVQVRPVVGADEYAALLAMLAQLSAVGYERDELLAQVTLDKLRSRGGANLSAVSGLTAWIAEVEQAYLNWYGGHSHGDTGHNRSEENLIGEIQTRSQPLRQLWDARGPGLLRTLGRLTDPAVIPTGAEVVMVLPAVGGHGIAHLPTNRVTFEAVLTNADESLPEVVRLGWLLGQLQFDLPMLAEVVLPSRLAYLASLAMVPPTLAAAEEVELVHTAAEHLTHALVVWRIASSAAEAEPLAAVLDKWWQVYTASNTAWPAAVAALEQMLIESPASGA